jgi:hypothetical protein
MRLGALAVGSWAGRLETTTMSRFSTRMADISPADRRGSYSGWMR